MKTGKQTLSRDEEELVVEVLRLRRWQLILNEELKVGTFEIPIHVAIGHEALAVAVSNAMAGVDQLVPTHRNMAYNLLRAGNLRHIRDEYRLAPEGAAGGRLGSMNLTQPERGVVYSSSILGNNIAVACGLALAKDVKREDGTVIVATGDGAMEEGPFYEGLVFARSHRLRVLIVVENNDHSMWSTIDERRCAIRLADMAHAVDVPFLQLSGNNPVDYASRVKATRDTVERSRSPALIEALLAPINNHAGATPGWPTDPRQISIENGLVVQESSHDPVFVLRESLGSDAFEDLAARSVGDDWEA